MRSFRTVASALGLAMTLSGLPSIGWATIMVPLTIEQMAGEAAAVVRGRVVEQSARWDDLATRKHIFTLTTIEVLEAIHGEATPGLRLVVRALGGEVGDVGMKVAGTPRFSIGEEVVVFARRHPGSATDYQVIGMSQGKFRIERGEDGKTLAVPGIEGIAFARARGKGPLRVDPSARGEGPLALSALRQRVIAVTRTSRPPTSAPVPTAPPVVVPPARSGATTTAR